ncbi:aminotransferase-like domain-containing protein [Chryseobacterium sp. T1]
MDSPAKIPFQSFVRIDRDSSVFIYIQVSNQIIKAIQRGILPLGTKLPGTRTLSTVLDIHRNTVVAIYDELLAQGWLEVIPNKGSFIIGKNNNQSVERPSFETADLTTYPRLTGFRFKKSHILDNPFRYSNSSYAFDDGIPDIRLTQIDQYSKFYSSVLKSKTHKIRNYERDGSEFFKTNLSKYLNLSRGIPITSKNLLITRSTEMSVYIASEILLSAGDVVLVADLSYFSINMILQKPGVKIRSVAVDKDGIDVEEVRKICKEQKIRMLYITPHHHYPTTATLSAERRIELLKLANEFGFIILEDDYDYDFHYEKSPILPLASADTEGMVVYIGSFGKSLAPGFRTGFIVAPENLMLEMKKYLGIIDRQGDILMEYVLGEMIEEGEIKRYLKKSIKIYHERRDQFADLLQQSFGDLIDFEKPTGGLATWLEWSAPINLMQLSQKCESDGLFIPKTLLYQNRNLTAMRLGFGNLNAQEMENALDILLKNAKSLI